MPHFSFLGRLAVWVLVAACLGSCGIRLPVPSKNAQPVKIHLESSPGKSAQDAAVVPVWLIADKYHTGMVFPYAWLLESGFVPPPNFGNPKCVTMSWGSRIAYSKPGVDNPWKFIRVIFSPTPSVMEMIHVDGSVMDVCPQERIWQKLVARDRGPALATFLNECTTKQADGRPTEVCASSWGRGTQLECRSRYFIPRICNVWTVQTIECLGGKINPWFALTADGLSRQAVTPPNDFELIWSGRSPR